MDALDPLLDAASPRRCSPDSPPRDETNVSPLVLDVMTYAAG